VFINYSGWRLKSVANQNSLEMYIADKTDPVSIHPRVMLYPSSHIVCEGYWPFPPRDEVRIILSGTCLYTACWSVQFAPARANDPPPRPLSLALPGDMKRILTLVRKKRPIAHMNIPLMPGLYHYQLLTWQASVINRLSRIEEIRYHLPTSNYHIYIKMFEDALGIKLMNMHIHLHNYIKQIKRYMVESWNGVLNKLTYIEPYIKYDKDGFSSKENDLMLYLDAAHHQATLGVEDLPELSLACETTRRTGNVVPCIVGVLDLPDPYMIPHTTYGCRPFLLDELR
jgi:hypothetical protein